ncbi:hypothetical protein FB45DRAFT_754388 [Roridomyces roridus]|uniref:Uncharacterized protein n=1 Tax=Roridomyces roridus TaxID=1738132 RepID=A0AAD7BH42_9AGAR|nr:hypothetical protein FB45DRAFT_754388 [Roridomyces roridus]
MVFIAAVALFFAITAHWIATLYRAFLAFIHLQGGDAAVQFYVDMGHTSELVQEGALMISIMIGDSLIIHRLWVVWEHRVVIVIFPICSLIALTTCSAVSMYTLSRKTVDGDIFSDLWLTSNGFLTLATNLYCTSLITFKIWSTTRGIRPIGGSNLRVCPLLLFTPTTLSSDQDFLVIVVESAAIYASWAVFFTVAYQTRSIVQFAVIQTAPEIVGIANALIHTRVGLGYAIEAQVGSPPPSQMAFARFSQIKAAEGVVTRVSETSVDYAGRGPSDDEGVDRGTVEFGREKD